MAGPFVVDRNGVVIDAPAQQVFEYLSDMARHVEWNLEPDFLVPPAPSIPRDQALCFAARGPE